MTSQHGPRDLATILASRYWLTEAGEAVVDAMRAEEET